MNRNMMLEQARMLHKMGLELVGKVKNAKGKEIRECVSLAMDCWRESREIYAKLKIPSDLIFLEHLVQSREIPLGDLWPMYVKFCSEQLLQPVNEDEFLRSCEAVFGPLFVEMQRPKQLPSST